VRYVNSRFSPSGNPGLHDDPREQSVVHALSWKASQWTGALRNAAFFAYADTYLIDVKFRIIMECRGVARGPARAQFEFTLAAIAQNLRRLAKPAFHPPDAAVLSVA
jgi:hypothetical protein